MTVVAEPGIRKARASHPLRAEAVRGFAPWAGAAVLLTLGVVLAADSARWQGGWAETASALHVAQLITLPLAAAAGCWQGGRERRRRTAELWGTVVRAPLARFLASALPVACWVAVGHLAAAGLAMLATWPYTRGDRPHLAALPGDALALAATALLGHVVGRSVPTRLAAPLLAMAGYVGLGVAAAGGSGAGRCLNPAAPVLSTLDPVWWQPWAMGAWAVGLALTATLAYAARYRATALLPLAAASAAGALLVQTGDALWQPDPLARHQVCDTSTTPAVCVNARYPGLLPQVSEALSGVTGKLEGVRNLPLRWEDRSTEPHAGEAELPLVTPFGWSVVRGRLTDPEEFAWEAVAALRDDGGCPQLSDRRLTADDAVQHYLAPNPAEKTFDDRKHSRSKAERAALKRRLAARDRLAHMGREERRAWLSAYFASAGDCRAKGVPAL